VIWIWAVIAALLVLDAIRVRGRASAIAVLPTTDAKTSDDHVFLVAPGVTLDEATKRRASEFARQNKLGVLDLVPTGMNALAAWGLLQFVDPAKYRAERLGKGLSAGHAVLVTRDVLTRARVDEKAPLSDAVALVRLVGHLKRYASTTTDLAIAPGLVAIPVDPKKRFLMLRELVSGGTTFVMLGLPILIGTLVAAGVFGGKQGLAAIAAFELQPLLALAGTALSASWILPTALFRIPLELWGWIELLLAEKPSRDEDAAAKSRVEYASLVKSGLDHFFEPRRLDCPLCQKTELTPEMKNVDLLQRKPGNFVLDRCVGCGHVFQNPRLSIEGLGYYYKDFYDGLGEAELDAIFGAAGHSYIDRAKVVQGHAEPKRWLDVGGGHGHFACAARDIWPKTTFDGLDLSEAIEEAERRGWIDVGYRGLFPEKAAEIAGRYDVVSMSHYLEHTRDPAAEIEAAATALEPGGLLMIEVPDPECPIRKVLGRLWLPYFQPQHQHLVSVGNMGKLLEKNGFTPVVWHRKEAHQPVDMIAAVILILNYIAPKPDMPWRPKTSGLGRAWHSMAYLFALPTLLWARTMDNLFAPIVARLGSNTYRVLARKGK
jgi:SAM-dependent methyltransferase